MSQAFAEHVSHLRTVHFQLLLACFVVFTSVSLSDTRELDEALRQAQFISRVTHQWNSSFVYGGLIPSSRTLQPPAGPRFQQLGIAPWTAILTFGSEQGVSQAVAQIQSVTAFGARGIDCFQQNGFRKDVVDLAATRRREERPIFPAPSTIAEFRDHWDAFDCIRTFFFLSEVNNTAARGKLTGSDEELIFRIAAFEFDDGSPEFRDRRRKLTQAGAPRLDFRLHHTLEILQSEMSPAEAEKQRQNMPDGSDIQYEERAFHVTFELPRAVRSPDPETPQLSFFRIPASTQSLRLPMQEMLLRESNVHRDPQLPLGRFSQSFPLLSKMIDRIDSLNVDQLVYLLEERRRDREGTVQLFSASIPLRDIAQIGLAIVFCINLYFLVHLEQLRRSSREVGDIAPVWIGIGSTFFSRLVTLLSAVAIPSALCIYLLSSSPLATELPTNVVWAQKLIGAALGVSTAVSLGLWWRSENSAMSLVRSRFRDRLPKV